MLFGVAIGSACGIMLGNLALGIGPGIALGVAIALVMSSRESSKSDKPAKDIKSRGENDDATVLSKISEKLLTQRLRNRIMEVLSIYSTDEDWELLGPDEVINQWADFVDESRIPLYIEPVFSKKEREELLKFHELWLQYCDATPNAMPRFNEIRTTPEWQRLKNEANKLLAIFEVRGRFDEEVEINKPT